MQQNLATDLDANIAFTEQHALPEYTKELSRSMSKKPANSSLRTVKKNWHAYNLSTVKGHSFLIPTTDNCLFFDDYIAQKLVHD